MQLPQEDSFAYSPRQNYRSNIGIIDNPMGIKEDAPQFPFQCHSRIDSLKRNNNFVGMDKSSQEQLHHRNASSGKI